MAGDKNIPSRSGDGRSPEARQNTSDVTQSSGAEVDAFLRKVAQSTAPAPEGGRGRLIFAMDATASRQPTWDQACHIQAEMFKETSALGGLEIQLVFYRGFGECKASSWIANADELLRRMTSVSCFAGHTQIGKVLNRAIGETKKKKVGALVFVGDAVEEDIDHLGHLAGELGVLGVPCFMFHEGLDPIAAGAFQQIARLSGGAYCSFDASSARQLRDLLAAVAVYAAGGRRALVDYGRRAGGPVLQLTHQIK
ncbi:VWA domain-containing protein [Pelagibius sp. Alg239-R121]|uniref:VWA domain-containing protein n=1 Tax=Pelagibius sp. Alg239-R121 TaxID=2993448 RepID=UPI0024A74A2A|nr:VWA domain-containing protein [Pelagibius sp. Alg239-R121]